MTNGGAEDLGPDSNHLIVPSAERWKEGRVPHSGRVNDSSVPLAFLPCPGEGLQPEPEGAHLHLSRVRVNSETHRRGLSPDLLTLEPFNYLGHGERPIELVI